MIDTYTPIHQILIKVCDTIDINVTSARNNSADSTADLEGFALIEETTEILANNNVRYPIQKKAIESNRHIGLVPLSWPR